LIFNRVTDTGLMSHLARLTETRLEEEPGLAGWLLETFVMNELRKQATWSTGHPDLFHFRAVTGREVDLILEDAAGRVVGVEIKASTMVTADDFRGLDTLRDLARKRFHRRRSVLGPSGSAFRPRIPRPADQRPLATDRGLEEPS
jgi:hypothetical protein